MTTCCCSGPPICCVTGTLVVLVVRLGARTMETRQGHNVRVETSYCQRLFPPPSPRPPAGSGWVVVAVVKKIVALPEPRLRPHVTRDAPRRLPAIRSSAYNSVCPPYAPLRTTRTAPPTHPGLSRPHRPFFLHASIFGRLVSHSSSSCSHSAAASPPIQATFSSEACRSKPAAGGNPSRGFGDTRGFRAGVPHRPRHRREDALPRRRDAPPLRVRQPAADARRGF